MIVSCWSFVDTKDLLCIIRVDKAIGAGHRYKTPIIITTEIPSTLKCNYPPILFPPAASFHHIVNLQ